MNQRGIIISPLATADDWQRLNELPGEWENVILCADGGYDAALKLGLKPDLLIGDLDSIGNGNEICCPLRRHPVEKDETDTVLCLQEGVARGLVHMVLLGGFGGRLDHTYANIQTMAYAMTRDVQLEVIGQGTRAMLLKPGSYTFDHMKHTRLSLFAYSHRVEGLTLRGVHYSLTGGSLSAEFPLGVSNRITQERAEISFEAGLLLAMFGNNE